MCLRLKYEEALQWKAHAAQLVADSRKKAASIPCDPLFRTNPQLSSLVSEVDGIKKRHGLLLEKALIFAIGKLPGWKAGKEEISLAGGKAHLDCVAYNETTHQLYVFECKRGHGSFDADKMRAIDERLRRISAAIGPHAASKGWTPASSNTFILSFYGTSWKSSFPIFGASSIGTLFGPCIGRFMFEYMHHVESYVARTVASELGHSVDAPIVGSIFDEIDDARPRPWPDVFFSETAASLHF